MGKQLMGGVPVLGDALHRVGEAANRGLAGLGGLGGAAAGFFTPDRVAGLLGDQLLDTVFDTLPQVQDNLDLMRRQQAAGLPQEDRLTGGDVALAAAGNFLMNALYNLGSEAVPAALRAIGEKLFANAPLTEAEQQALKEFYAGQDEAVDGAAGTGYDGEKVIYSAEGIPELRATRRPEFGSMMDEGFEVEGVHYGLNKHAYNSLFKSGRKDVMPADIIDALKTQPGPACPGSIEYVNPITGTRVFVSLLTNEVVGIWPAKFKE